MSYLAGTLSAKVTPQSEPIPESDQVKNSAGGYSFKVDQWTKLDRFLVLGAEGGTYYASQREVTLENAKNVIACIETDGPRTVARIVEISDQGRAPKNDPAILALALCLTRADTATKRLASAAVNKVCRIGTHLFQLVSYIDSWKKWNRTTRRAVADWYRHRDPGGLAYQMVKYQNREKWSHHDVMHVAHPKFQDATHNALAHWAKKGWDTVGDDPHPDENLRLVWAFERAKRADSVPEIVGLIRNHRLPREGVPTQFLNDPSVWEALLYTDMPYTALIRNLAKMTAVGLIAPMSDGAKEVVRRLENAEAMAKARIHPIALLAAHVVYGQGHGERGSLTWNPVQRIVDALDRSFYAAFKTITPTGKRHVLALDVSGSMGGAQIAGIPGLTARVGAAAMALVTAATETEHVIVAFTSKSDSAQTWRPYHKDDGVSPLAISPDQRLDDVVRLTSSLPFGGTDCALPMLWALENKVQADAFTIYTDSETWAGRIHPTQALARYRDKMGIGAKLIVCGMVANGFTIADPKDAGMLDVVGFDTNTPAVMADFVRG